VKKLRKVIKALKLQWSNRLCRLKYPISYLAETRKEGEPAASRVGPLEAGVKLVQKVWHRPTSVLDDKRNDHSGGRKARNHKKGRIGVEVRKECSWCSSGDRDQEESLKRVEQFRLRVFLIKHGFSNYNFYRPNQNFYPYKGLINKNTFGAAYYLNEQEALHF
jgi:hypothetical protein